jgi:hypothetical protein
MSTYNYYSSYGGGYPPSGSGVPSSATTMNDFVVLSKLGNLLKLTFQVLEPSRRSLESEEKLITLNMLSKR